MVGLFCCVRNNNIKSVRIDNGIISDNLYGVKIVFYVWNKRNSWYVLNSLGKKFEVCMIVVDCRGRVCYKMLMEIKLLEIKVYNENVMLEVILVLDMCLYFLRKGCLKFYVIVNSYFFLRKMVF